MTDDEGGLHALALEPAGPAAARDVATEPTGGFVTLDGEPYYRIRAYDRLPPFLVNLPTDTDLWMFVSSAGGLTAGRRDPDGALLPYETVDRLHDAHHVSGPVTLMRIERPGHAPLRWQPFTPDEQAGAGTERALAKSVTGDRLVFEETHRGAGLAFRYRWAGSDPTGWVRTATLENLGPGPVRVALLDGLRNVLPAGAPLELHQHSSCLVDAYRRADVDPATGLAVFSLTARISDRPEPAEMLRATTVWGHGLPGAAVALSAEALAAFRRGEPVRPERVLTGRRGNYLAAAVLELAPGERATWHLAADTGLGHAEVVSLRARLRRLRDPGAWIEDSLREADASLRRLVASADGLQLGARAEVTAHHLACVLYNIMRGGVFVRNHALPARDFAAFVRARDRDLAARRAEWIERLPSDLDVTELHRLADAVPDPGLQRLALEYLPLHFGRRHGDPSRPWNRFSIRVRERDGERALRFEGNWRDVFQNWEALARSFPGFLPGVIARFMNASTVDGYNPYRISRDGFDWEVLDPAHPWSGIGYWGDHQVVYLLRLLEALRDHQPGALEAMLDREVFAFADVPYRLEPYARILADPRASIRYDDAHAARVAARVAASGHDGRLVRAADGAVAHAGLLEKLLIPVLAKLSSYVPDGGIWMNTMRPEWNDANNALAGYGLSVVTLFHLWRHLGVLDSLVAGAGPAEHAVSSEVAGWLRAAADVLARHPGGRRGDTVGDADRRRVMDALGASATAYRERVYAGGFSDRATLPTSELVAFLALARAHLEHGLRANRRSDGLYHAYNVLEARPGGDVATVRRLGPMLEGQVAALASGFVGAAEAAALLERLFEGPLFRADQRSFMLYPEAVLPPFLERNLVPETSALAIPLVRAMLAAGETSIVERDAEGAVRFHGGLSGARDVAAALDRLQARAPWAAAAERDRDAVVALFEDVFGHRTYTGRSGTMYAYEGLGCIYWHMVAKLLLAVQEVALRAHEDGEPPAVREALAHAYERVRAGLGPGKTVREYGAFPTDPYSHSPAHAGARQPGMTGQVKEEILARFGELGVRVRDGLVAFDPVLLRRDEFLADPATFEWVGLDGAARALAVPAGALAFTYAQVPVVYALTRTERWIRVTGEDGFAVERPGGALGAAESEHLLARRGGIARIDVGVPAGALRGA